MAFDLTGKRALITGGTSGIGLAVARKYAEFGAEVFIAGRSDRSDLAAEFGATFVTYDASRREDAERVLQTVTADGKQLDILVANAGVHIEGPVDETTDEMLEEAIETNLIGVGRLLLRITRFMTEGSVIVTSSTAATYSYPGEFAYGASKAGLEGMVRTAARDLAGRGIRVNSVRPGPFDTPMAPEGLVEAIGTIVPAGRLGDVSEAAYLYLLLGSVECKYITGTSIAIDGGESIGMSPGAEL